MMKRIISLFLAALFAVGIFASAVRAADDETDPVETEKVEAALEETAPGTEDEPEEAPPAEEEDTAPEEETEPVVEETEPLVEETEPAAEETEDEDDGEYILISDEIGEFFYNAPASNSTFVESSGLSKTRFVIGTTWTDLPYSSSVDHMEGIQFQTNSPYYYFDYRVCVRSLGWSDYCVSTDVWKYPGTYGYAVTNLEVKVHNNYINGYDDKDYVIMYRSKVAGEWLSWVSNGSPEVMNKIKSEFSLDGELDYAATESGWASRGNITALQVKMFEKRTHDAISSTVLIDAPYINQKAVGLPNGCESVSAVMAIQYADVNITPETFVTSYLPMGRSYSNGVASDPSEVYVGDPHLTGQSGGWGCYAPVIVNAAQRAVSGKGCTVANVSGESLQTLCSDYIDSDTPVIVWATVDMTDSVTYSTWATPQGKKIEYNNKLHCLLLVGYDSSWYYFNDPMTRVGPNKYFAYPKTKTETAYNLLGKQAVVVSKIRCTKIELLSYPTKNMYLTGEDFDPAGFALLATYSDGSTKTITSCSFSGADTSSAGEKTVTFSYTDPLGGSVSGSFKIYVYDSSPRLISLDIGRLPFRTEYAIGESFKPDGLVVYAGYEQYVRDGDNIALSTYYLETEDYRTSGYDSTAAGKVTVFVTSGDVSASFEVTIVKVTLGDVNSDGKVTMKDVLLLRRYLSGLAEDSLVNKRNADVTRDGKVTNGDILLLRKYLANIASF